MIHSKHNGSRTKEQKAVQLGWATGGGLLHHRRISLHWHKQLASRETGFKSMNHTDNRTDFARAIRSMQPIILIFIMCDLALAWFAGRELHQESERRSKVGGFLPLPELRSTAR